MLKVKSFLCVIKRSQTNEHTIRQFLTKEFILNDEIRTNCVEKMKKTATHITRPRKSEKSAAVLVPIVIENDKQISLLYTQRSGKLRNHVRQVAFPG